MQSRFVTRGLCTLVVVLGVFARPARGEILLADPTVFRDGNRWILAGTENFLTDDGLRHSGTGRFPAYVSGDLRHWSPAPAACPGGRLLDLSEAAGADKFWAPQIFRWKGRHYLVYTVDFHWAIAVSDNPLGPYVRHAEFKQRKKGCQQIDAFLFGDDDGRVWAYVSDAVTRSTAVMELSADLTHALHEPIPCVRNELPWEHRPLDAQALALNEKLGRREFVWGVGSTEGPSVLKRRGKYVLFYCGNDFQSPDYCVGVAVADRPDGPWTKQLDGPVLSREQTGLNGTGHGDAFVGADGAVWYLFHAHHSSIRVSPRRTGLIRLIESVGSDGSPRYAADPSTMRLF